MDNGYLTRSCKESERFRANRRSERAKKQADDSFLKKTFFLFEDQLVQTIMRWSFMIFIGVLYNCAIWRLCCVLAEPDISITLASFSNQIFSNQIATLLFIVWCQFFGWVCIKEKIWPVSSRLMGIAMCCVIPPTVLPYVICLGLVVLFDIHQFVIGAIQRFFFGANTASSRQRSKPSKDETCFFEALFCGLSKLVLSVSMHLVGVTVTSFAKGMSLQFVASLVLSGNLGQATVVGDKFLIALMCGEVSWIGLSQLLRFAPTWGPRAFAFSTFLGWIMRRGYLLDFFSSCMSLITTNVTVVSACKCVGLLYAVVFLFDTMCSGCTLACQPLGWLQRIFEPGQDVLYNGRNINADDESLRAPHPWLPWRAAGIPAKVVKVHDNDPGGVHYTILIGGREEQVSGSHLRLASPSYCCIEWFFLVACVVASSMMCACTICVLLPDCLDVISEVLSLQTVPTLFIAWSIILVIDKVGKRLGCTCSFNDGVLWQMEWLLTLFVINAVLLECIDVISYTHAIFEFYTRNMLSVSTSSRTIEASY